MRRRAALAVTGVAALAVGAVGCDIDNAASGSGKPVVVATVPHIADFVRVVGGDRADVVQLLGANVDPHDFEPEPADMKAVHDADILVQNGVGLEAWLADTIEGAGFDGLLVDASDGVAVHGVVGGEHHHDESDESHHDHGTHDPHIWHDPHNAVLMVENIADALAHEDPGGAQEYQANLADYRDQLMALDREIAEQIDTIPVHNRKLVTNHGSLGYYASRYGLEYVGSVLPSFSTSAELSTADIDGLAERIRQTGVPAVFAENGMPADAAETIADEAGVEVIAGEAALYTDGLGAKGSPAGTYLAMMRHNTDVIVAALS